MCNETMKGELIQESACWLSMSQNTRFRYTPITTAVAVLAKGAVLRNCGIESVMNGTLAFCASLQAYVDCGVEWAWEACPVAVRLLTAFFQDAYPDCRRTIRLREPVFGIEFMAIGVPSLGDIPKE